VNSTALVGLLDCSIIAQRRNYQVLCILLSMVESTRLQGNGTTGCTDWD
jgi:hypothetical protein